MTPIRAECLSYPVSIFMAGDVQDAETICRAYCDEIGFCVTVSYVNYVYKNGSDDGFVVGLINYPRFPLALDQIWRRAEELADMLRDYLGQQSYTIQAPDRSCFYSTRDPDPQGDAHNSPAASAQSRAGNRAHATEAGALKEPCDE